MNEENNSNQIDLDNDKQMPKLENQKNAETDANYRNNIKGLCLMITVVVIIVSCVKSCDMINAIDSAPVSPLFGRLEAALAPLLLWGAAVSGILHVWLFYGLFTQLQKFSKKAKNGHSFIKIMLIIFTSWIIFQVLKSIFLFLSFFSS